MACFLVYRSPNNRNMLPYVNPTIFVGCQFQNLSLVNKWRLILWLVVPVTLCYVDVWFWSSHDLGLTSRHRVQRESLKTVTKLDPELTEFCIRSESLIFLCSFHQRRQREAHLLAKEIHVLKIPLLIFPDRGASDWKPLLANNETTGRKGPRPGLGSEWLGER